MAASWSMNGTGSHNGNHASPSRKVSRFDGICFDPRLRPRPYQISGAASNSRVLLLDVTILDSTGREPYTGNVLIEGERFSAIGFVPGLSRLCEDPTVQKIEGRGRTLMSGLGDAHTHLTWNNITLELLGDVEVEEHTLITARSALCYLDSGYTMCYGAASAKDRLDCAIRDAINRGEIPGPRLLANGKEIAKRNAELASGITAFADGPLEMREVIRHHAALGVDQIKLSMSGEAILETRSAEECFFSDEETAACVDEAHRNGLRVCAHARARDSVIQCARHNVDVIYHASYTDEEGLVLLEAAKDRLIVAPAINWLYATVHEAEPFGYTFKKAEQVGYKKELEAAISALKKMHEIGITILPGGDYGFAWCPHGTYARDLEHFVKLLGFSPMESVLAATAGVAKLFMQEHELGKVLPGYYADCILVNGNPLEDIAVLQDRAKLDVIIINGRIHKADGRFATSEQSGPLSRVSKQTHYNFVAFKNPNGQSRIGHLNHEEFTVHELTMLSGSPLTHMGQVIELGEERVALGPGEPYKMSAVTILPPLVDRDVICVGNNYHQHVKEYRESGFDSSAADAKVNSLPTVFTKRSTSIIATGRDICPHPEFTATLDYEGEVGVIIGKPGFRINEENAMAHVWGYTIINDVTARERQRDHKQFFLGKSPDTYCPMGPVAVAAAALPSEIRIQTFVNGEKRQDGTTAELIVSIPKLIELISSAMSLQAGDVIATGTPHGVGVGFHPPKFLKPGDMVEVSVSGLGKLSNRIAPTVARNTTVDRILAKPSMIPTFNQEATWGGIGLTKLAESSFVHARELGSENANSPTVVFIHGLGASIEYYMPLIQAAGLEDAGFRIILYDLEGHGMTPTKASAPVSLESFVADLEALLSLKSVASATLIGWSLGGLIAMLFAQRNGRFVERLVLLGPGPNPFPEPAVEVFNKRAALVREQGMDVSGVANAVAQAATAYRTKSSPLAYSAIRQFLLSTHPEGYAKGCIALARSRETEIDVEGLEMPVLIVAGRDDSISPLKLAMAYKLRMKNAQVEILDQVGHWHVFEVLHATAEVIKTFLSRRLDS